ncbi:hypothetical protein MKD33_12390, partial [Chromobacterium piscinae]
GATRRLFTKPEPMGRVVVYSFNAAMLWLMQPSRWFLDRTPRMVVRWFRPGFCRASQAAVHQQ